MSNSSCYMLELAYMICQMLEYVKKQDVKKQKEEGIPLLAIYVGAWECQKKGVMQKYGPFLLTEIGPLNEGVILDTCLLYDFEFFRLKKQYNEFTQSYNEYVILAQSNKERQKLIERIKNDEILKDPNLEEFKIIDSVVANMGKNNLFKSKEIETYWKSELDKLNKQLMRKTQSIII